MIAEIIINSNVKSLNRIFDYNIPKNLENIIRIGSIVLIPFGRGSKFEEGYVINIKEKSDFEVKDIERLVDNLIPEEKVELANWMARRYFSNISDCIKLMLPPGTTTKVFENRVKEKSINVVSLKKDINEIELDIQNGKIKSEKQIKILRFLSQNNEATLQDIQVFTEGTRAIVKTLEKHEYVEIKEQTIQRNPFINKNIKRDSKYILTEEQNNAFITISEYMENEDYGEFLLYGITGSGKTEVYLQLIEKALKNNKSSIILVPEISLTPQMVDRFIARFGQEIIAVLHSKLSVGERFDSWQKIRRGEAKIIIGARSAIFAPAQDLGLIIIDEEHDSSYKSEMNPRYNAKEISRKIAYEKMIPLVLGSATPEIPTYYKAKNNQINLLKLSKRANNSNLPTVKIIDLRQELANGNRTMLSMELYDSIKENIKNKKQTILFLNRRGFSTFIMCRDCGYTAKCKNCNISLTYHKKEEKLKCHYCGYEEKVVKICPECGSNKIRYFGTGTQKLEEEINKMFPEATTIRMDIDTVTKKNSHEEILNKFKNEGIDILIGTQMIVKGHHFPNVTLVGVIAADSSLNIDDYRAHERTFDLLVQVAGRAGRDKLPGKVIIQTYNPDNFSIEYAKKQNYDLFYNTEIKLRKQLKYPPFCDIILFGISGEEENVKNTSEKLYIRLKQEFEKYNIKAQLFKPLPAPIDKIKNKTRWRIIIKGILNDDIIDIINNILNEYFMTNNANTRIIVDVNPNNMM